MDKSSVIQLQQKKALPSNQEYMEQADKLWHRIPNFNVMQVRYFENLLDIYANDLQRVSLILAANPTAENNQTKLVEAAAHVNLLKFIIERMKQNSI